MICTEGSQVVPHPGTGPARRRLTSEFRWDRVSILSPGQGWYRSAKAQNSTKAPLTGNPNQLGPHMLHGSWESSNPDEKITRDRCDGHSAAAAVSAFRAHALATTAATLSVVLRHSC